MTHRFLLLFLISAFALSLAQAGPVESDGLSHFIKERKRAVGNTPIRPGISNEELKKIQRVNLAKKNPGSSKTEEDEIRAFLRRRTPLYADHPELLIGDAKTLLNEAISATSVLQSEWNIIQKVAPGSKLTPIYLGPDAFLRMLRNEILSNITVDALKNAIPFEIREKLYFTINHKFTAIENKDLSLPGVRVGPRAARSNPELLSSHRSFWAESAEQFKDWFDFVEYGEELDFIRSKLNLIQPQTVTFGEAVLPAATYERNVPKSVTTLGGLTVEKTTAEPARNSSLSTLEETLYSLVPAEEKIGREREVQQSIRNTIDQLHLDFWYSDPSEEGEGLVVRDPDLLNVFEKNEGKPVRVTGLNGYHYPRPNEFSYRYEDWLVQQIDRMIRNNKDLRLKYFGNFKFNWKEYTKLLYENLEQHKLPEMITSIEMNKGFLSLFQDFGLVSSDIEEDFYFISKLDFLRLVKDPDDVWNLFFGLKRGSKLLRNDELAKVLLFMYEDADPITRFQLNQSVYNLVYGFESNQNYTKALTLRYGEEVGKNIAGFSRRMSGDYAFRVQMFEEFISQFHALPREDGKSLAITRELQGVISSFFVEGGNSYLWEKSVNPKSVCIRGTH